MPFNDFELFPFMIDQIQNFLDKFISSGIGNVADFFNSGLRIVIELFNYLGQFISWLASYSGLNPDIIVTALGLIAGGIGLIISSFVIKFIVRWWSALAP